MSMPSFPEKGLDISEEQSLNMLLASIAMEELALSHIMNAEGEKLQYLFGTGPCHPCQAATVEEVLQANQSVTRLLDMVMQNQMLLKGKLQTVLDAKQRAHPKPPCANVESRLCLTSKPHCLFRGDCLSFCHGLHSENKICWTEKSPCTVLLAGGHTYTIAITLQYYSSAPKVCFTLEGLVGGKSQILQPLEGGQHALQASFLLPITTSYPLPVVLRLFSPQRLQLNCAEFCLSVVA